MEMSLAYITTESEEQARSLGRRLVESKLAACVNFWSPMHSLYWWEGKVEEGQEVVLIAKTRAEHQERVVQLVRDHHSYAVPCVVFLPVTGGNPDYLKWLQDSTENSAATGA